ncbi:putative Serpin family protein [Rosa chinensis]|uniref:Putative Serpin family protein n=1 Tax=Rosa chinensis TaxID=74649 RepID=A0A2P6P9S3_ROSCH|nr:serpin-ZX isoform X1 [Rosa chinensis]XP_040366728.1 serpin-ZX isoform X1 [Rosa chinensis]PRQ18679.1 putative Serpin family protein [Rosa chinensis]
MDNKDDDHPARQYEQSLYTPSIPQYTPSPIYIPQPYRPAQQYEHPRYSPCSPSYIPQPCHPTQQYEHPRYSPSSPSNIPQPYHPTRQYEHPRYSPFPPSYSPCSPSSPPYFSQRYHPTIQFELPRYSPGRDPSPGGGHLTSSYPLSSFKPSRELRESIKNQTDVALEITKQLLLTLGKDKNMVYSPLSIHIGLGMILTGTKGHIQDRFLSFLKSKSINELNDLSSNVYPLVFADGYSKGGPRFSVANGVWVEKSIHVKPRFKEVLDTAYKAAMNQVDFRRRAEEVRCEVNSWVDKETNGSETKLILANALYFKGAWNEKFYESMTKEFDFHLQSGSSVKAPFMTSSKYQFVSVFDSFKVLKLPYEQGKDYGRRFSMCLFLPNATDGLQALVERVCSEPIDRYIPHKNVPLRRFLIPKFKISVGFDPMDVLKPLGFSLEEGDLTEMVEGAISLSMFQKSFIEVNEEGTEAAAVYIACGPAYSSGEPPKPPPIDFVADHPFLYLIREEVTGTVMFIGHVLNPIEEKFT